jgi:WD repeat-containing protein 48
MSTHARRREPRLTYLLGAPAGASGAHCGGVNAVRASPDGRHLFTGSRDGTVRRWALGGGAAATSDACFEGHTDWVNALTWLSDGVLASASCDGTLRLWRANGVARPAAPPGAPQPPSPCIATLRQHKDYITALASAPGAPAFASAGLGGEVYLWDASVARVTATLPAAASTQPLPPAAAAGARASVYALAMASAASPPLLAAGGAEHTLRLWDARTPAAPIMALRGHTDTVRALALDATGTRCLSAGADRVLRLWDLGTQKCIASYGACHTDSIWALLADDAFTTAWTGGRDGALWCTPLSGGGSGGGAAAPPALLAAPRDGPPITALAFDTSPSGGVWVGTSASSVTKWPRTAPPGAGVAAAAASASPTASPSRAPSRPPAAASASSFASGGFFQGVRAPPPPPAPAHAAPLATLAGVPGLRRAEVLPDRRRILTQDAAGDIALWDIAAASRPVRTLPRGADFDAARTDLAPRVAAPAWFTIDTRLGCLAIHLDCPGAFAAEAYANELNVADAAEDVKLNLGLHALLCVLGPWARARAAVEAAADAAEADARDAPEEGDDADAAGAAAAAAAARASAQPVLSPPQSAFQFPSPPPVLVFDAPDGVRRRWDASALTGSDAEAAALPGWAVDAVLRGRLPVGDAPKCSFHLVPLDGCGLPPLAQSKLSAPRILRAHKIAGYLATKLELSSAAATAAASAADSGDGDDGGDGDGTALLELSVNGSPLPWDMSLASAAAFLWKRPEDIVINYAPARKGA